MNKIWLLVLIVLVPSAGFGRERANEHTATVYADPFEYCRYVRNAYPVDINEEKILDSKYSGPVIPKEVAVALKETGGYSLYWRCMDGRVYGCFGGASGRACLSWNTSKNPSAAIREFCRTHPNSSGPSMAENDTPFYWTCVGKNPVLDKSIQMPQFDRFGYYKDAWIVVPPIATKPRDTTEHTDESSISGAPSIPEQFRGSWNTQEGNIDYCKFGVNSDSRFTVASSTVTYYEAQCQLRKIGISKPNAFTGSFDCEGEGRRWQREISLTLDGGKLVHKGLGTGITRNNRCK